MVLVSEDPQMKYTGSYLGRQKMTSSVVSAMVGDGSQEEELTRSGGRGT